MALAFALMAILPVLAATATIEIDEAYTSAAGTFEIEIDDQDVDSTVTRKATLTFDVVGVMANDTYDLTTLTDITGATIIQDDEGIASITVIDDGASVTSDLDESENFSVTIFDAEAGLIGVQTFVNLDTLSGDGNGGHSAAVNATVHYEFGVEVDVASLDYVEVKITSVSDKTGISVTATETELDSGIFEVTVAMSGTGSNDRKAKFMAAPDEYDKNPWIFAAPGETVTAKYTDVDEDGDSEGTRTATIKVEANDTVATVVSPAHDAAITDTTPDLSVDFTDTDSGVDEGSIEFTIHDATHSIDSITASTITGEDDVETSDIDDGFRGTVTLGGIAGLTDGGTTAIKWSANADDEAGNNGETDSDNDGDDYHILIIDEEGPDWEGATATAGAWYDADEEEAEDDVTKSDNTVIGIEFDKIFTIDSENDLEESLDAGSVAVGDFSLDDLDLADGTSVSNYTPLTATVYAELPNWIFLTVAAMAPDAAPTIELTSGISDAVGNTTSTGELDAVDGQAPTLTVTLNTDLDDDEVTVTIVSNEALASAPTVWANAGDDGILAGADATHIDSATADVEATNEWEIDLDPGTGDLGAWSVGVSAKDTTQNETIVGEPITEEDWPTDDSIVFYLDDNLANAVADPADGDEPELSVPFFITLDFSAEAEEYGLDSSDDMTTTAANIDEDLDEHDTVTITAITLDGEDVSDLLDTQDDEVFTIALLDIETGDHELEYTAEDEMGNEVEDVEIEFTVKARSDYKVAMSAGWNLISLPGNPTDSAIDSVLDADHPATNVLSYKGGAWSVATRAAGATWEGSLTAIDGLSAYWVNTTSSAPVEALLDLPAAGTANTLPTVPVDAGWNMVPVIDLDQDKQDSTADGTADATGAAYFTSISWSVAYTYDASTRTWTRITPSNGASVFNGDGVWVWATKAGTLIP